ncbi:MAG: hypothetical protein QGF59_23815, partial [Pirellulaceae bacterium]|nr:hypothetical protein [Pirellulaceae bacterium]
MEKDRDRRYQSATALEEDIDRYLAGDPIAAKAPSAIDYLKRFARKHKAAAISIAAIFVVLVGAVIAISIFAVEADQLAKSESEQRKIANEKTVQAEAAEAEAQKERDSAIEARTASRRQAYFGSIAGADAAIAKGEGKLAREFLDSAPEEDRAWEWRYLNARADNSLVHIPLPFEAFDRGGWGNAISPSGEHIVNTRALSSADAEFSDNQEDAAITLVMFISQVSPEGQVKSRKLRIGTDEVGSPDWLLHAWVFGSGELSDNGRWLALIDSGENGGSGHFVLIDLLEGRVAFDSTEAEGISALGKNTSIAVLGFDENSEILELVVVSGQSKQDANKRWRHTDIRRGRVHLQDLRLELDEPKPTGIPRGHNRLLISEWVVVVEQGDLEIWSIDDSSLMARIDPTATMSERSLYVQSLQGDLLGIVAEEHSFIYDISKLHASDSLKPLVITVGDTQGGSPERTRHMGGGAVGGGGKLPPESRITLRHDAPGWV